MNTLEIDGQLDIFHAIALAEIPQGDRITCDACGTNWGISLKQEVKDRHAYEHRPMEPGICAHMIHLRELLARLEGSHGGAPEDLEHLANVRDNVQRTWSRYTR